MVQENNNSAMEMGTSDQVLVAGKKKKNLAFILGGVAMLIGIGIVITLVVVLSANDSPVAEDLEQTTLGPTQVTTASTTSSTSTTSSPITDPSTTPTDANPPTTDATPTTDASPTTDVSPPSTDAGTTPTPPPDDFELNDIINGVFIPNTFNGSWITGNSVMFRNENGELVEYDLATATPALLIANTSQILQQSSRVQELSPSRTHIVLAYSAAPVYRHSFLARYAAVELLNGNVTEILPPTEESSRSEESGAYLQNFQWGPTGTSAAFVYKNNIFYISNLTAQPSQITTNGVEHVVYNGIPDWVYEEEVFSSNNAMWFSADGSKLAYATFDDSNVRIMRVPHYGVPGSMDYQYTTHHEIRYPKPGTTNPTVSVKLKDLESGQESVFGEPSSLDQPILRNVRFVDNDSIAIMWTNRRQDSLLVQLCTQNSTDAESTCTEIFTYNEENGWIDNIPLLFNEAGDSFITILPQAVNGVSYKQIVQVSNTNSDTWTIQSRSNTAHTVLEILTWTNQDVIWYKATSVEDSAEQHIFTVNSEREVQCFTCNITTDDGERCLYNDAVLNSDVTRVVVNCAGPGVPQLLIYDQNGALVQVWDKNEETSKLLEERQVPLILRRSVPVAEGFPDADVHIQVPADYAERNNVPLLVYVYGGPDSSLVTKQWSIDWGTSIVSRWNVAVAHIDGRGSGLRGVANTFALNRRLGTFEIEDQIAVTRYLHNNLTFLDSNRTCIWGWSYGGYAASLALARGGDTFRCAAAVAPVVDWRFYDTIYTERYMDTPLNNLQAYDNSSLLTEEVVEAFRNKRYFLIHGTADDNVHYQHAMLLSRLLQRQDVYFHQMSYTDEDHGLVGVRPHLYHALEKFLKENML